MPDTTMLGHNRPPDAIADLLALLQGTHTDSIARSAELADMGDRLPASCEDDDIAAKLADGIKACTAFAKNADAARVAAKEPHLAAGRAVDGFFKKLVDPVDKVKLRMGALLTAYQRKKADEERRRREAEAAEARRVAQEEARLAREAAAKAAEEKRAAEEAARLAREAATKVEREAAVAAQAKADQAAEDAREAKDRAAAAKQDANVAKADATVKAADLTRARSDLGSLASLRTTWAFEIEDPEAVPRTYLSVNEGAIRAAIKSNTTKEGKCPLRIPGVRIYEKQESVVR